MAWLKLETRHDPAAPSKRECHTIVTSRDKLVLFGGNDDAGRFREVHILDAVALRWTRVAATEAAPGKRSAHSAVMAADGVWMYVFGGWNGTEELGDVSRFNIGAARARARACDVATLPISRDFPHARARPPPPTRRLARVGARRADGRRARAAPLSDGRARRPPHVRACARARSTVRARRAAARQHRMRARTRERARARER